MSSAADASVVAAFSQQPSVDRSRSSADTHAGCSHVHMCPTGVVIVGGLADSSAMGSCVHCIQSRVSMSRSRRRRRGV